MRNFWVGLTGLLCLALGYVWRSAETLESLNLHASAYGAEKPRLAPESKDHYLSTSKDYLRAYVRENLFRIMADRGMTTDEQNFQTAGGMDITKLYQADLPLGTKVRFWADEDIQRYLSCGRFLPVKIEMESLVPLSSKINFQARLQAPFNDLMKLELGSFFSGPGPLTSKVKYVFADTGQVYAGLNLGFGLCLFSWRLEYECNLSPGMEQMQRLSIDRSF